MGIAFVYIMKEVGIVVLTFASLRLSVGKPSKVLVLFTNLREDVPDELFNFPPECFPLAPM